MNSIADQISISIVKRRTTYDVRIASQRRPWPEFALVLGRLGPENFPSILSSLLEHCSLLLRTMGSGSGFLKKVRSMDFYKKLPTVRHGWSCLSLSRRLDLRSVPDRPAAAGPSFRIVSLFLLFLLLLLIAHCSLCTDDRSSRKQTGSRGVESAGRHAVHCGIVVHRVSAGRRVPLVHALRYGKHHGRR